MKLKLMLSLLTVSLLPVQLCATIVNAKIWQRPNGTRIVILGDARDASDPEEKQASDFVEHLANKNNAHLLAFTLMKNPPYPPTKFAQMVAQSSMTKGVIFNPIPLLPSDSVVLTQSTLTIKCLDYANTLLKQSIEREAAIPAPLKDGYKKLQHSLTQCIPLLPQALNMPMDGDIPYNEPAEFNIMENVNLLNQFLETGISLYAHTLVASIADPLVSSKETLVYFEESNFLSVQIFDDLLSKLGYTCIATHGTYTEDTADTLYGAYFDQETSDQETNALCPEEDPVMRRVMNHFALNLKDVFNK